MALLFGSDPHFVIVTVPWWSGGEEYSVAEQVESGVAVHLPFEDLKSYVESAGVMMFPRCNHGLGR
jgi:hypothetical protein